MLNLLNLYSLIFAQFDKISDMVEELQNFRSPNGTIYTSATPPLELNYSSMSVAPSTTILPYSNFEKCLQVCAGIKYPTTALASATLATTIIANITTTALPKLIQTVTSYSSTIRNSERYFEETENITQNLGEEYYSTNTYYENDETMYNFTKNYIYPSNITDVYENNITYMNINSTFPSTVNKTNHDWFLNAVDDFKENFQDYLSYILNEFDGNIHRSNSYNYTPDHNSTMNYTNGDYNVTSGEPILTSYEYLKTTVAALLNITENDIDERFQSEFSSFCDEITSTVAWTTENFTKPQERCRGDCESEVADNPDFYTSNVNPMNTRSITTDVAIYSASPQLSNKLQEESYQNRSKLRSLCWETMFGQELVKLTVMDLVFTALGIIAVDFFRGLFVRFMNKCWCWDLEKKFPEYGEFKVAENILHLVNNQGLVWMGMFFSPGIVLINVIKLMMLMYLRSWAVMTCNVPHAVIFRASRSNNFYFALLLTMLFLCVLPVGYAIVWVKPSWHCGPFSNYDRMFHIFTNALREVLPKPLHKTLDYIASPGIIIPLLILLVLIIYYLISLTNALREANDDLKVKLQLFIDIVNNSVSLLGAT